MVLNLRTAARYNGLGACLFHVEGWASGSSSLIVRKSSSSGTQHKEVPQNVDYSASTKLWLDAEREEAEEQTSSSNTVRRTPAVVSQHDNWTGEESLEDAVLRMLVDKYKPLRGGTIVSADEKLKRAPPSVSSASSDIYAGPSTPSSSLHTTEAISDKALLPPVEGHKPWLTTFKAPSHAASIKLGNFGGSARPGSTRTLPLDEQERKIEKEARKRSRQAERLTRARESMIDYRMGIKTGHAAHTHNGPKQANPSSLKGWAGLVEERIERARAEGHFRSIKGRGKEIVRQSDEGNPFIAREEFLMNRIVQRNGAAPPWVELQGELETAVRTFRDVLRQSWTRRAIRTLTATHPLPLLAKISHAEVKALRDVEWEARERAYHDTAIEEVNALVRKYNGLAPYPVRRPYHVRSAELERAYAGSTEDILKGIAQRVKDGAGINMIQNGSGILEADHDEIRGGGSAGPAGKSGNFDVTRTVGNGLGAWEAVRSWWRAMMTRAG